MVGDVGRGSMQFLDAKSRSSPTPKTDEKDFSGVSPAPDGSFPREGLRTDRLLPCYSHSDHTLTLDSWRL